MIRLDFTQEIKAPVQRVFQYVTDFRTIPEWQDSVVESMAAPRGRTHVGMKVKIVRLFMGERLETAGEVTEYVPNQKFAFKSKGGPVRYNLSQTFSSVNGGTRLDTHMEMDTADYMQVSEGAVAAGLKQQFNEQERKLKEILER
jgi:uncharacterized protein YndB with AHSA1/START domain